MIMRFKMKVLDWKFRNKYKIFLRKENKLLVGYSIEYYYRVY